MVLLHVGREVGGAFVEVALVADEVDEGEGGGFEIWFRGHGGGGGGCGSVVGVCGVGSCSFVGMVCFLGLGVLDWGDGGWMKALSWWVYFSGIMVEGNSSTS